MNEPRLHLNESVSEDARFKGRWIVRSHIDWRGKRNIHNKGWKPLPSIHVLKVLNEIGKRKPKTNYICELWTWAII